MTHNRLFWYLQIGNQIYINYKSKSDNKLGYFKIEIQKALSPFYFDDKKKIKKFTAKQIRNYIEKAKKKNLVWSLNEDS